MSAPDTLPWNSWPLSNNNLFHAPVYETGWQCPKCQRVYAPSSSFCITCNARVEIEEKRKTAHETEWRRIAQDMIHSWDG